MNDPDISVIVVSYNTRDLLRDCLASVEATMGGLSYEVIVVDNASADGSAAMVAAMFPRARLIVNDVNRGFAAANNQAFAVMRGRYALLLNSDAVLTPRAALFLFDFMENHPEAAMACGQLLNADGTKQNSIAAFPSLLTLTLNMPLLEYLFPRRFPSKRYEHEGPVEVDSGIGACLMVRRSAMDRVGWFDEDYFFFFEETDWAYRMRRAGYKVYHVPQARIYHLQGQSVGHRLPSRIAFYKARYHYFRKWHGPLYYLAVRVVVFCRLLVDFLLTLGGVVATLGLARNLRRRLSLYGSLLLWHCGLLRP